MTRLYCACLSQTESSHNHPHLSWHLVYLATKHCHTKHMSRHGTSNTLTPGTGPGCGTAPCSMLHKWHSPDASTGVPACTLQIAATKKPQLYLGAKHKPGHGPCGGYMHQGRKTLCKYFPPAKVSSFSIMTVQNLSLYRMLNLGTCKPRDVTTNSALQSQNACFA